MHYILAFQMLCGLFGAFVADRKRRSRPLWAAVAAGIPIAGVVWVLVVPPRPDLPAGPGPPDAAGARRSRPARCAGRFQPDCLGCPHFRRDLFGHDAAPGSRGRCTFYRMPLVAPNDGHRPHDR